jgi:cytochrome c-type biogenesis protein CcmH
MSQYRILLLMAAGCLAVLLAAPAWGADELEARAKKLETKLMAPCCMANTLAEHESRASTEMRREIRIMLAAGRSEQEILDHYVALRGPQILSAPPARGFGLAAYVVPFVMLVGGAVLLLLAMRRWGAMRAGISKPEELQKIDPEYLARLQHDLDRLN